MGFELHFQVAYTGLFCGVVTILMLPCVPRYAADNTANHSSFVVVMAYHIIRIYLYETRGFHRFRLLQNVSHTQQNN